MADLVVLVGPVGAGKSTVAGRLAQLVRRDSMTAADVDMDDVAFMRCGGDDLDEFWRRAPDATAGLVRAWFDAGVGRHLASSIHTGVFCRYQPERDVVWS